MECFSAFMFLVLVGLAAQAWRARGRLRRLEEEGEKRPAEIRRLEGELARLSREIAALRAEGFAPGSRAPAPPPLLATAGAEPPPLAKSEVRTAVPAAETPPLAAVPPPLAPTPPIAPTPPTPPIEAGPQAPPPLGAAAAAPESPAGTSAPAGGALPPPFSPSPKRPPAEPPPLPPRAASPAPPLKPAPRPPFDWERLIGVKLFSWAAGILFALAAVYFLRISIDRGWLSPGIRMTFGLLFGAALLVVCELKAARRYAITANALDGAGIATLFSTIFAAHALWHILPTLPTFGLMALITAVAAALSIRRDSLFIALLGLIGGFATPILLSTGEDRPIGLFGYLLLLNAGLAWVARKRRWKVLPVLCLLFTTLYQWGWTFKFLDAARLPLAVGIFLIFPLLAFAVPLLERRPGGGGDEGPEGFEEHALRVNAWMATLPLLFALYLAAVPSYGERYPVLFGFLLLLDLGLAAIAAWRGPRLLHALAGGMTLLVFALWLGASYAATKGAAWPAVLGWISAFVLFYLAAPWLASRLGRPLAAEGRAATLAAPLLLFAFPLLLAIEPAAAAPGLTFGVLFFLLAAVAAFALLYEEGWLHFVASFFALAAEAVWSARHLGEARLLSGVALYGLFGLFYLGVPLLARRLRRTLRPEGSGAVLLVLCLGLLFFLAAGAVAPLALWGLALLLGVLNAGLFLEGRGGRWPALSLAGMVLSWIVVAVWWASVPLGAQLVPAMALVAGLAVLMMAGSLWMGRRGPAAGRGGAAAPEFLEEGVYLGLVGHLFLLFVVTQATLALPPWPVLGVLAVLDLAIGVAALYGRRAALHTGALVASNLVLAFWLSVAREAPWPSVAAWSLAALALFSLLWIAAARRRDRADGRLAGDFADSALAGLLLGEAVLGACGVVRGAPGLALLAPLHAAFLIATLALASRAGRLWTSFPAVAVSAAGLFAWVIDHAQDPVAGLWVPKLLFAGAVYLVFLAWPLALGERARSWRPPFLAAVLASGPFFLVAGGALKDGGFGGWLGLLPLAQAAALSVLLVRALRLAPPRERLTFEPGRLALVAGAVLAFVSVAIPLQLEKEWITIGWALLAAALAWLSTKIRHRGLLAWCGGLLLLVFVRLALNPAVLTYHPAGGRAIWNWYLYTYLVSGTAFFAAAWFLRRSDDRLAPSFAGSLRLSSLANGGGVALLFLLVNIEIADFFATGSTLTFGFLTGNASLAEDLASTLSWAVFAFLLLVAGIGLRSKAARVAAILLLVGASLKGFLHDLGQLGGFYRVGSFAGLAVSLALVAVLLQKFVFRPEEGAERPGPPEPSEPSEITEAGEAGAPGGAGEPAPGAGGDEVPFSGPAADPFGREGAPAPAAPPAEKEEKA